MVRCNGFHEKVRLVKSRLVSAPLSSSICLGSKILTTLPSALSMISTCEIGAR